MRWIMIGGGVVLALLGAIWLLQGVNILPGSRMSGQAFWAAMGLIFIVGGALVCAFGLRRKPSNPQG